MRHLDAGLHRHELERVPGHRHAAASDTTRKLERELHLATQTKVAEAVLRENAVGIAQLYENQLRPQWATADARWRPPAGPCRKRDEPHREAQRSRLPRQGQRGELPA